MMDFSTLPVAYLGPETMLPVTSAVAGVAGLLLMFGRNALRIAGGWLRLVGNRPRSRPSKGRPVSIRDLAGRAKN